MLRLLACVAVALPAVPNLKAQGAPLERQPSLDQPAPRKSPPPNILFLFADDQRPDAAGALGNPHIDSPHIDSLVRGGVRFANNYCMGSWHGAVCVPSRAMLMSGRSLHRVKPDLRGVRTLPETLAAAGYVTYGTGKWHNGQDAFARSFRYGHNIMFGGMSDHTRVPITQLDTATRKFSKKVTAEKFSSELFADAAIRFLDTHQKQHRDQPFFVYVAFSAPHDPRNPPEPYRRRYYDKKLPMPANFKPQVEWFADRSWGSVRDEVLAPWPRTEAVIRDQLAEYYGLITHMDDQIGRILEALDASGQRDNTIIVYAADHGLAVGSHGLVGKQNVFEHSMGCPLAISGPGIPKGQTRQSLTYLLDLYPTLCGLAGAEVNDTVEGQDLMPVVRGEKAQVRDSLFTVYRRTQMAVRDARYKLIRFPQIDTWLLFDLQEDPHELRNLAAHPAQADRFAGLRRQMESWQKRLGDQTPMDVDEPREAFVDLSGRPRKPDHWQPEWIRDKYFDGAAAPRRNRPKQPVKKRKAVKK